MEYIGEHILIGTIGQAFISIAFSAAILAAYSFYKSSINESLKSEWLPLARGSFLYTWNLCNRYYCMHVHNDLQSLF